MSAAVTAAAPPKEPQAFKRAVRKIRCAAMVASLAKSWQGWANDHSDKQDAIPTGWMPTSVEQEDEKVRNHVVKLTVKPRIIKADPGDADGCKIRACTVTKTVQPKRSECSSSDVVNAIKGKMESAPEQNKPFLGNESPTRRRQMRALQSAGEGGGGIIQDRKLMLQEKKLGSRSSSVETEDSGIGEEAGLSDNNESKSEENEIQPKKHGGRHKVESERQGQRSRTSFIRLNKHPTFGGKIKTGGKFIKFLKMF